MNWFDDYTRNSPYPLKKAINLFGELEEVVFGEQRTKTFFKFKYKKVSIKQILERNKDINLILQEKAEAVTEQLLRLDFKKFFEKISEKPFGFKVASRSYK